MKSIKTLKLMDFSKELDSVLFEEWKTTYKSKENSSRNFGLFWVLYLWLNPILKLITNDSNFDYLAALVPDLELRIKVRIAEIIIVFILFLITLFFTIRVWKKESKIKKELGITDNDIKAARRK
jgi:hypothetical protein